MSEVGITVPDLLDANETNWPFAVAGGAGDVNNPQVKRLATLASAEACGSYCGRTADADAVMS